MLPAPRARRWPGLGVALRSLVFLALVLTTLVLAAPFTVLLVLPRSCCLAVVRRLVRFWLWALKVLTGLSYEVRGRENLPTTPCLIASKHQSAFETIALQVILDDPAFVLKRELTLIPVAGWAMWRLNHIRIDRAAGAAALMNLMRDARKRLDEGRSVVIFPEGTRRTPLAPPDYKPGLIALYRSLKAPCVPVALNSGVFWPRRSLWRYPGRIVVEVLPPIAPGLNAKAFETRLQDAIESRSAELARAATTPSAQD
ncbi:lysophospholipid acyltransferase family protein [Stappia stellulata]|uniref:lysophospholipid acyltransferase family protein n=1 Tax=Stappia stellulata TaxID=71235 RepID=UPI000688C436|nr:lysophospholipid acyltransferase family protein [Stappia stellulata]